MSSPYPSQALITGRLYPGPRGVSKGGGHVPPFFFLLYDTFYQKKYPFCLNKIRLSLFQIKEVPFSRKMQLSGLKNAFLISFMLWKMCLFAENQPFVWKHLNCAFLKFRHWPFAGVKPRLFNIGKAQSKDLQASFKAKQNLNLSTLA